jgi:hypothetical protein
MEKYKNKLRENVHEKIQRLPSLYSFNFSLATDEWTRFVNLRTSHDLDVTTYYYNRACMFLNAVIIKY